MNNTPTPETDAVIAGDMGDSTHLSEMEALCRKLEIERDQLKEQLEIAEGNTDAALNSFHAELKQRKSAEAERNQLKKVLDVFETYHVFETKTI